jgi:hypothetical protein
MFLEQSFDLLGAWIKPVVFDQADHVLKVFEEPRMRNDNCRAGASRSNSSKMSMTTVPSGDSRD